MDFFKENWMWIVIPFAVVMGGLLALVAFGNSDAISPFVYTL